MDNMMNFWLGGGPMRARQERKEQEKNGEVLHSVVGDYTIDSCYTFDEGYETAIWKNVTKIIIVERYADKEKMEEGHEKWCAFCENNPKEVFSAQSDEIEEF